MNDIPITSSAASPSSSSSSTSSSSVSSSSAFLSPDQLAVGYVVGEVKTDEFTFVTNPELAPPRLEYIVVRGVRERAGDGVREADVLAQVSSLSVNSRLLSPTMNYSEVEAILRRLGASPPVVVGQAKVLGYFDGRSVRLPRGAAMPGAVVERAPDALLASFFSQDVSSGLEIGSLINRPQVKVLLDPNGLRRHMAVIAQTGAGKSYTVGVVLEKLLELGGTVVVFDPNSDYVLMGRTPERRATPFADRVEVYRVPSEQQSRITDAEIGRPRRLTVQFSRLEVDEICDMAGISEKSTNIRVAVKTAYERLSGRDFTPRHLHEELESIAGLAGEGYGEPGSWGSAGGAAGGRGGQGSRGDRGGSDDRGARAGQGGRAGGGGGAFGGGSGYNGGDGMGGGESGAGADPFGVGNFLDSLGGLPDVDLDPSAGPIDPEAFFGLEEERAARREVELRLESSGKGSGGMGGGADGGGQGKGGGGGSATPGNGSRGGLGGSGKPPTPDAIAGAGKALKYIEFLAALRIWGFDDVPLDDLLRPMSLSTIDLAGVDRKVADFIVTKVVSDIWKKATRDGLRRPVFLVLEEAHNFVPAGADEGKAGWWLKRIASEGRKFGIFLVLITQRPYRVHQDTLSQCGSQIIMRLTNPEDQNAVRRASESISESLLSDLPGLNVGEAVILGPLVRVPVMVRIAGRQSDEGGSDIDIAERLSQALSEVHTERLLGERRAEKEARGRSEWREEV